MGSIRCCGDGSLLSIDDVRKARHPDLLPAHFSSTNIPHSYIYCYGHRALIQRLVDAGNRVRLSTNPESVGCQHPDREMHQSTGGVPGECDSQCRLGLHDPATTGTDDQGAQAAIPAEAVTGRYVQRGIAVGDPTAGATSKLTRVISACIVSIIRLKGLIPTLHNPDQTWAIAVPGIWV